MEVVLLAIIAILIGMAVFELDQIRTQAPASPARTAALQQSVKQAILGARGTASIAQEPTSRPATVGCRNPRQRAAEYERTYVERLRKEAKEAANA